MVAAQDDRRFWPRLTILLVVLVALPLVTAKSCDLDGQTPVNIAMDALHDNYGLRAVDLKGDPIPQGSAAPTVSEFSLESGATTADVAFFQDHHEVTCTIHAPSDDPADVTADCSD